MADSLSTSSAGTGGTAKPAPAVSPRPSKRTASSTSGNSSAGNADADQRGTAGARKKRPRLQAKQTKRKLTTPAVLRAVRDKCSAGASKAIFKTMQSHMLELDELIMSISQVDREKLYKCHEIPPDCHVEPLGQDIFRQMQQKIVDLEEMTVDIKLWIRLHLPKIKTGGSAYFAAKKRLHGMVVSLRSTGLNVLQQITQHMITRAAALAAIEKAKLKGPVPVDLKRKVVDLDLLNYHNLLTSITGVRNAYCLLVDRCYKDFDAVNIGLEMTND